ncbi:Gene model 904, (NCBI) [Apodemus speciosus]|uniref:Gene model 904, (NCBI) n=1 Tax=Apodemus speciosus TaxID=105296 RepID=A0ABQ0FG59_APOSI
MEKFLALIKSISDSWMSPSSVVIAMDMTIAFLCGAGLFFLLLPFLKELPVSPPPESERDMPKVWDMGLLQTVHRSCVLPHVQAGA